LWIQQQISLEAPAPCRPSWKAVNKMKLGRCVNRASTVGEVQVRCASSHLVNTHNQK
jgi:hypothetical protein